MRRSFLHLSVVLAAISAAACLHAADDQQILSVAPVTRTSASAAPAAASGAASTSTSALPDAEGASAGPSAAQTLFDTAPAAAMAHRPRVAALTGIEVGRADGGMRVLILASGPITGAAANLSRPNRVLIRISGVGRAVAGLPRVKPVHRGDVERVRYAVKSASQAWVVVDLTAPLAFRTVQPTRDSFEIVLLDGGARHAPAAAPAPEEPQGPAQAAAQAPASASDSGLAQEPRINLMLFDINVIYQGKHYDRFPCANFIYNASDRFPLKRDFVSTLVFSRGYGAFVGNARVLDPDGRVLAQTEQPFAFNLFNTLSEYFVELPWTVEFTEKGYYTLWVDLNGADVLSQPFYVGQTTDRPPPVP